MLELWQRAANTLTTDELKWFADSREYTRMQALNLSEVMTGIGCLVGSDEEVGIFAGNFRDSRDVSTLLFSLAHQVETIAGMMEISDEAKHHLDHPEMYKQ